MRAGLVGLESSMGSTKARVAALSLALVLVLAACGSGSSSNDGASAEAATFTAEQIGGGELSSASLDGKDTVLWFWAPWCTRCRAESGDVVAAAEALDGSVEIVGVAGRGSLADSEAFLEETGTGGLTHVFDEDGSIWASYEVLNQPAYAFIDDDGSVTVYTGVLGEDGLIERMSSLAET